MQFFEIIENSTNLLLLMSNTEINNIILLYMSVSSFKPGNMHPLSMLLAVWPATRLKSAWSAPRRPQWCESRECARRCNKPLELQYSS
jgi:hypothetical protein